jgi:hypothetical protein
MCGKLAAAFFIRISPIFNDTFLYPKKPQYQKKMSLKKDAVLPNQKANRVKKPERHYYLSTGLTHGVGVLDRLQK